MLVYTGSQNDNDQAPNIQHLIGPAAGTESWAAEHATASKPAVPAAIFDTPIAAPPAAALSPFQSNLRGLPCVQMVFGS